MIEVKFDEHSLKTAEAFFHVAPTAVRQAGAAAINRTLTHLRKASAMKVRERYVAKAGTLKTAMGSPKRATSSNMSGVLDVKGVTLPLTAFNIKTPRSGPRRVQVLKHGGAKPVPGLFGRYFPSGYRGPMMRIGHSAYPLKTPAGPSVPQMVGNEETLRKLTPEAERMLNDRFEHEILWRIGGIK